MIDYLVGKGENYINTRICTLVKLYGYIYIYILLYMYDCIEYI